MEGEEGRREGGRDGGTKRGKEGRRGEPERSRVTS